MKPIITSFAVSTCLVASLFSASCSSSADTVGAEQHTSLQNQPAAELQTSNMINQENPFFRPSPLPFKAPEFNLINNEHYMPAFEQGMREQLKEIEAIASNPDAPDFDNTIAEMERTGKRLTRVQRVFFNMTSAHTNSEIQRIQAELSPKLAEHSDNIYLNGALFERVRTLHNNIDELDLNPEQGQLLKRTFENFVRAGALLTDEQQQRVREINGRLSALGTQFSENMLNTTRERAVLISSVEELDGLSSSQIEAAKQAAKARGHEGKYLLNLTNTTRQPITASLNNRETRRKVWEASAYRGLGRDGHIDNQPLILEIARLRAERAQLLGFDHFAAYRLEPNMAGTPEAAYKILLDMLPAVKENTRKEAMQIQELMFYDGIEDDVKPWDWEYYAEKVRLSEYNVSDAEIRPYFELERVIHDGMFYTMKKQYGITFEERFDLPVYHPDVRVFDVFGSDGEQIGLFYADYFARDSKRGGAWMSSYVVQNHMFGHKPVIVNVLNIPPPPEGEPALISLGNVTTLFHEMGHAVHGLFSDVYHPSLAGTATPRDFVEFPSTFEEDWAIQPEILANYAFHYETGEPIPGDLLERFLQAQQFNQGFDTFEYLAASLLDLDWHTLAPSEIPDSVEAFEKASLQRHGVDWEFVPPRYTSGIFNHVWPGGYASSYYAYIWSEVLAADAFRYVLSQGGIGSEASQRYRKTILSRGGSQDPMELYREFRGQDPTVDGLLIRRGLATDN
ncbi:MAG: M3 family metallopeptidase [Balneolales bacterium]|nr:M3 family metallopeptidase [Balneolales bacterium]